MKKFISTLIVLCFASTLLLTANYCGTYKQIEFIPLQSITYKIEEMQDMCEGIYVKAFSLFHGDSLQYYISESRAGEENVTQSSTLSGSIQEKGTGRFAMLNDVFVSLGMQDDATAKHLLEEYLQQDFYARELFRVI